MIHGGSIPGCCHFFNQTALFYCLRPGPMEGNCENRTIRSSRSAGDIRRLTPLRRSSITCTPLLSVNGYSAGIPQRLSPGCLFMMLILFLILAWYGGKYRQCPVTLNLKAGELRRLIPYSVWPDWAIGRTSEDNRLKFQINGNFRALQSYIYR